MLLPVAATDPDPSGFTWTEPEELVFPEWLCTNDDPCYCGCGRAFHGLTSHRATTLAVIRDVPMDFRMLRQAVICSLARGGWVHYPGLTEGDIELVAEVAAEMISIADHFGEGTVLMRHMDDVLPAGHA